MINLTCIILAAGKGTRMKSEKAKVLHEICFKPMLHYPVKLAVELGCKKTIVVAGHQEDEIQRRFHDRGILFASQKEQLGTGHAVLCAMDQLDDSDKNILIVCGDSPLLKAETVRTLYEKHTASDVSVSILTATATDPTNYGRIVKDDNGDFLKIIEERDADDHTRRINEVNTGTYIVKKDFLRMALAAIGNNNSQNEYYLTDIAFMAVTEEEKVVTHCTEDFSEAMGINTRADLAAASRIMRHEINNALMLGGVTIIDPERTYIEEGVTVEADTVIHPGVTITGATSIGCGTTIHGNCVIIDSEIGRNANVLPMSILEKCAIMDNTSIGPFARLRPGSVIKEGARIGNFVEIKKSVIDEGSKANHLSYIGDSTIGKNVNIGAGTITCNYDGVYKHQTEIEDDVFIGSNTAIVAPVTIKSGALIGAGSVITKDVPEDTVAVERTVQKHYKRKAREK